MHNLLRLQIQNRLADMEEAGIAPSHPDRALLTKAMNALWILGGPVTKIEKPMTSIERFSRAMMAGYIYDRDLGDESDCA